MKERPRSNQNKVFMLQKKNFEIITAQYMMRKCEC